MFTSRVTPALVRDPGDARRIGDVNAHRRHARFGDRGRVERRTIDPGRAPADQLPDLRVSCPRLRRIGLVWPALRSVLSIGFWQQSR
jgi:hypothetical protein